MNLRGVLWAPLVSAGVVLGAAGARAATGVPPRGPVRACSSRSARRKQFPSPARPSANPARACRSLAHRHSASRSAAARPLLPAYASGAAAFAPSGQSASASGSAPAPLAGRFWIGGQANVIAQGHGNFHALYSGPNSLSDQADATVTSVEDLFSGFRVTHNFDLLFDVEDVRGDGLSNTLGVAGFPDLDAQKTPSAGNQPHAYVSRFLLHYVAGLGGDSTPNDPSFLELGRSLPSRRLELYFGKFNLSDFFDQNDYAGSDHSEFLNWTTGQNGAWDYAANTPGYTYGAYLEFHANAWTLRYAEVLMTKLPNGLYLNLDVPNSRAANAEVDWAYDPRANGTLRLLGYVQQARMGSFADALAAWHNGLTPTPDVSAVRRPDRHEYGFGLNWQQGLPGGFGLFARSGWNNGKYESYSYTEVNNTIEGGLQIPGGLWGRAKDRTGVVLTSNGISLLHREYLAAGGLGFQLGDGGLTYGRERILEGYYNWMLPRGLSAAPDIQWIANPGYNRARGPVVVFSLRLNWNFGFHRIA